MPIYLYSDNSLLTIFLLQQHLSFPFWAPLTTVIKLKYSNTTQSGRAVQ